MGTEKLNLAKDCLFLAFYGRDYCHRSGKKLNEIQILRVNTFNVVISERESDV